MAASGVVVTTATRSGPTGTPRAVSGQYFAVGLADRGPTNAPVKINSMGDYRRIFGDRVSYGALFDDLSMYFESGGQQAQVLRVVGDAATVGTLTLQDTAAVATLRFDAASPGAWSTRLTVQVENGTNGPESRKITLRLDGAIVEVYNNLTSIGQIESRFAGSPYVKVSSLGSATTEPNNLPVVLAATPLSAGTDDRAAVSATQIGNALPKLKIGLGDGSVAAPGFGQSVHSALIAHANEYRRVAILSAARGSSAGDLAAIGIALGSVTGAQSAGLFGPHVQVADGAGGIRVISPEGYVAGGRARAHDAAGPWQPGAGEFSVSPYILGLDQEFTRTDAELLDAGRVNPIRLVAGRNRVYGWRSLSSAESDYSSLAVMDLLNRIVTECEARLEPFVFDTIDGRGQKFAEMKGVLIGILEPLRAAGGLFEGTNVSGEVVDPGYSVNVGPNINTAASLAANEVHAQVAVRPAPNASLITLQIVKAGLTAAV